jgi:ribosome recycling factor
MTYLVIQGKLTQNVRETRNVLNNNLSGLRTGRASSALVENIMLKAYNNQMPINQLGSISVPDAKTIAIQVYDQDLVKEIVKSISSFLNINPQCTNQQILVRLPQLTEERRKGYVTAAKKYSEESKIAVRLHRRTSLDELSKLASELPQDTYRKNQKLIQESVNLYIKEIDIILQRKTKDIMSI